MHHLLAIVVLLQVFCHFKYAHTMASVNSHSFTSVQFCMLFSFLAEILSAHRVLKASPSSAVAGLHVEVCVFCQLVIRKGAAFCHIFLYRKQRVPSLCSCVTFHSLNFFLQPFLHCWNKLQLFMMCNPLYMIEDLVCQNFVRDFYTCISKGYLCHLFFFTMSLFFLVFRVILALQNE